jgi:hypothetical protein
VDLVWEAALVSSQMLTNGRKVMTIIRSRIHTWFLVAAIASVFHNTESVAQQPQIASNYPAFVAALSALSASAGDLIQNERNAARRELFRQKVTIKIIAAFPIATSQAAITDQNNTLSLDDVLDEAFILCGPRWVKGQIIVPNISARDSAASITIDHMNTLAQQNYLSAVSSQLQSLAAPTAITDILSAFKALFASYQVQVSAQPTVEETVREQTRKSCEADLQEFDAVYYGAVIPEPPDINRAASVTSALVMPDLSFLGPMGTLGTTIAGIVQPVLQDFANIAADLQKRQAIKDYLTQDNNQNNLKVAGRGLARTTSDYLFAKRLMLAGTFAEQIALIGSDPADLTSKEIKAACPQPSSAMYERSPNGLPNAQFMRCYHTIWEHFEQRIDAALKTAAAYDQLADAGDTSTGLNNYTRITNNLSAIAEDNVQPAALWQTVTKMLTFAGVISTGLSQDTWSKPQQAFDAAPKRK